MVKPNAYDYFLKSDDNARKILLATLDGIQCKADIARKSGVNKVTVAKYVDKGKGIFSSANLDLLDHIEDHGKRKFQYYIRVKHDLKTFIIVASVVLDTFSVDEINQFMNSKYVREQNESAFDKYKFELILFYNVFKTNLIQNNKLDSVFTSIRKIRGNQSIHDDSLSIFSDITKYISNQIKDPKDSKKLQSLATTQTTRDVVIGTMNDDDTLNHLEHFLRSIITNMEKGLPIDDEGNLIINKENVSSLPSYLRKIPALQQLSLVNDTYILDQKEMILLENQLQIDISLAISTIFGGPVWEDYKWILKHSPTALKMICAGGWRFADDSYLIPFVYGNVHGKNKKSMWGRILNDELLIQLKNNKEITQQILACRKGLLSIIYHSMAIDLLSGKIVTNPDDEKIINRIMESFDESSIWVNRDIEGKKRKANPS